MSNDDTERFRLRRFMETLVENGECHVHDDPIDMIDVAAMLDGNFKAVWFKNVGPERAELVGNVMGARSRLALSLETTQAEFPEVLRRRLATPIAPVEVSAKDAPVQQVVLRGSDADLTKLPVHLQHELDGAPYISASIDFARDPATGFTNIGCRRMMLRGPQTAGVDLNAPSDLRMIYQSAIARGERLEVAYTVGSHPTDFLAGVASTAPIDEFHVLGAIRGAPVPIVKCATVDVYVPADAEYVLEGYLDNTGLSEPEGPYGEYLGYYGEVKRNPVFHLTAITRREDALFQTVTIGGRYLARTDTAQLVAAKTEATIWDSLRQAIRNPIAVCCTPSCGGMYNVRVSMRQRYPGEARNAIAAVFGSLGDVKHVFVVDEDIDVFSDEQIDWALATRFQADRDFVVASGFRAVPIDPSLVGSRIGAKGGFDCTKPVGQTRGLGYSLPEPPRLPKADRASVEERLTAGPATFLELMAATGTRDGRELLRTFDALYQAGRLGRLESGSYVLTGGSK
ncbi:MAG: UbiD family decarboxylase [Xanthobacteraceae bacterium]|nr:UbiD family decarboxylase [Xanthobacteraceae bacterium]